MERLCELIYTPFRTKYGYGRVLSRCIPKENVNLYEIKATCSGKQSSSAYYFLGRSKREAKIRFQNTMGTFLNFVSIRMIPPGEEAERILTNKFLMPTR